jgi:hypothetical protein
MQPRREAPKLAVLLLVVASVASAAPQVGCRSSNRYVQVNTKGINVYTLVYASAPPISDLLHTAPSRPAQLPGIFGASRRRTKTSPHKAPVVVAVVVRPLASPCRQWVYHPLPQMLPKKPHRLAGQPAHVLPRQTFGTLLHQTEEVHRDA